MNHHIYITVEGKLVVQTRQGRYRTSWFNFSRSDHQCVDEGHFMVVWEPQRHGSTLHGNLCNDEGWYFNVLAWAASGSPFDGFLYSHSLGAGAWDVSKQLQNKESTFAVDKEMQGGANVLVFTLQRSNGRKMDWGAMPCVVSHLYICFQRSCCDLSQNSWRTCPFRRGWKFIPGISGRKSGRTGFAWFIWTCFGPLVVGRPDDD